LRLGPRSLAWSADSQNLFFSGRLAPQDANGLFVLSVATGETRKLTTPPVVAIGGDGDPALSPDGHTVAFMRGPSGSNLGIFTLALTPDLRAAAEPKQITDQRGRSTQPAWSPDGRDIIFSVESQGGRNLWRAPADGSEKPRRMPGIGEDESVPAISVRAHRLVYSRHAADDNIWRLDTRTGAATRFVSNTLRDLEPRYSPDGRRVAFTSNRSGQIEVWTAEADGSNQVQLTDMKTSITSAPRWSPDGRQIVFISTLYGQSDVFVMGAAGGAPRRLTDTPSHDTAPAWSHDGKWIYFSSNRGGDFQIYKMPAAGGQAIQVTKKGGYAPLESPDGRSIYYARRSTLDGVWQVPVDGGDEVQVTPGIDLWGNFAVVDSGIFFVPKEKGAIQFFDFATRQVKTIAKVDKPITFGLTATADGRTVLYTQTDREIDELILVEDFH
jgi:Tol biopolymer transport system component